MSGGSMDYLYSKLRYAVEACDQEDGDGFKLSTPLRVQFRDHLLAVADALKAIEWNDSGDGDDNEDELIKKVLPK